jgi:hypothetical protein
MDAKKKSAVIYLLFIACFFGYCGCQAQDTMEQDARDHASSLLNKLVVKCGDVWCAHIELRNVHNPMYKEVYYQFTKTQTIVESKALNNEDISNGMEWHGTIRYKFEGSFRKSYGGKWGEWQDADRGNLPLLSVDAKKYKGKPWDVRVILNNPLERPSGLSCSDIPK